MYLFNLRRMRGGCARLRRRARRLRETRKGLERRIENVARPGLFQRSHACLPERQIAA
jgi:hypothetical protein